MELLRPDSLVKFSEGEEWHERDKHDYSDHQYSLKRASADAGNALKNRLAVQYSSDCSLENVEANQ